MRKCSLSEQFVKTITHCIISHNPLADPNNYFKFHLNYVTFTKSIVLTNVHQHDWYLIVFNRIDSLQSSTMCVYFIQLDDDYLRYFFKISETFILILIVLNKSKIDNFEFSGLRNHYDLFPLFDFIHLFWLPSCKYR